MGRELLDDEAVQAGLATLEGSWTGSTADLRRSIEFADFPTAAEFVGRLVPVCEALEHHPDLALSWRRVGIVLSTHSAGGVTALDLQLASEIDKVASTLPQAAP